MNHNYEELANNGVSAEKLATIFLQDYFKEKPIQFPINPFEILNRMGIAFSFRPFNKCEGIYIPAESEEDIPVIGINLKRPIVRQRYTAAHELCHYLKDSNKSFACAPSSTSTIERYAENFAGELLMPFKYLKSKANEYAVDGYVSFDDIVEIANYFGVSFQSCVFKLAYRLHMIKGNTEPIELKKRINKYKPNTIRNNKGYSDVLLYSQLFNYYGDQFIRLDCNYAHNIFKNDYIYYDSRMEGVDIELEKVAEIVTDLRLLKSKSKYCQENNQNIIEVAGLSLAYDYAFDNYHEDLSINQIKEINKLLYSTAPFPEFGGEYRQINPIITGSKVEIVDCWDVVDAMYDIDNDLQNLNKNIDLLSISEYLREVIEIHHRLTVIHAFADGNGRTYRVFLNMMLLKKGISPTFFTSTEKDAYKNALSIADETNSVDKLIEVFCKSILKTDCDLSPKSIL